MEENIKSHMQAVKKMFAAPLIMVLVIFFFHIKPIFFDVSFQNPTAFHQDILIGNPSTLSVVQNFFKTGHPPLWISNQVMGCPYLGLYLPSVSHPFVLGLFWSNFAVSLTLMAFINAELIAIFGFLLFRRCGASRWASAVAGLMLALSGFVPWLSHVYPIGLPVPWLLCWIWSAIGLTEKSLYRRWIWNMVSTVMIVMSGDAQITVQGAYILGIWYLLWAWRAKVPFSKVLKNVSIFSLAAAAGWVLVSVQMFPTCLYFSRAVTTRAPQYFDYASTYPHAADVSLATIGLFTRLFDNLFFTFSAVFLIFLGVLKRRQNPALQATMIVVIILSVLIIGGRSGLAFIPFNLPMLKLFIRHYKVALLLQGPLFIGVALGFDALIEEIDSKRRTWIIGFLICAILTLFVLPDSLFRVFFIIAAFGFLCFALNNNLSKWAPVMLFLMLAIDCGSYAWQTPYKIWLPDPDPIYHEFIKKHGPNARVQGMYPWIVRAGSETNHPLPVHGNGYNREYSIDSWLEFPLQNHAYFMAAINPQVAQIKNGEFSKVDFITSFKSTDFVTPKNRRLVNLASIKYFFLQAMALSEADIIPILSDPAYLASPANPSGFSPFKRINDIAKYSLEQSFAKKPAIKADGFGVFNYDHTFSQGDVLSTNVEWKESKCGHKNMSSAALILKTQKEDKLIFVRTISSGESGKTIIEKKLGITQADKSGVAFSLLPQNYSDIPSKSENSCWMDPPDFFWIDPQIHNKNKTIKYRGGDRLMVFENEEALGRARIVHQAKQVKDNDEALDIMRNKTKYDPAIVTLLMNNGLTINNEILSSEKEFAEIISDSQDEVLVKASLASEGYLVLSDTYYPGWRAFNIKGEELRIYRADINFRAIKLQKGDHEIKFRYLPLDFRLGLFITLSSIMAVFVFSAMRFVKNNKI